MYYENSSPGDFEIRCSQLISVVVINNLSCYPVGPREQMKLCSNAGWTLRQLYEESSCEG